jgi:glutamate 5-kinase
MTHTVKERGEVVISAPKGKDEMFENALTGDRVLEVNGKFSIGDTILLRDDEGKNIAKATTKYSSCLLNYLADKETHSKLENDSTLLQQSIVSEKHMAVLEVS